MKEYCVYIVADKKRSLPMSRYKAYKIRKHFKSRCNMEIKVVRYMDVVFEDVYDATYVLWNRCLFGG